MFAGRRTQAVARVRSVVRVVCVVSIIFAASLFLSTPTLPCNGGPAITFPQPQLNEQGYIPTIQVDYGDCPLVPVTFTFLPSNGQPEPDSWQIKALQVFLGSNPTVAPSYPSWLNINPPSGSDDSVTIQFTIDPSQVPTHGQTFVFLQWWGHCCNWNGSWYDENGNYIGGFDAGTASVINGGVYPWTWVISVGVPTPPPTTSSTDMGPCDECVAQGGGPINFMTGDVWLAKTDYSVPGLAGGLSVGRTWNSFWQQRTSPAPVFQTGMFGQGWISNLEERLQQQDSTHINYWRADGNLWIFLQGTSGSSTTVAYSIQAPQNHHAVLLYDNTALLYTMTFPDGSQKIFDNNGYLQSWSDRNGNTTTISYDSSQRITQVTAPGGQFLKFAYANAQFPNLATSAQDSVGAVANYSYTGQLLAQVTYPDASALQYGYDANNNISSVTDAQGKVIETHTYDSQGYGLTSSNANGVNAMTLQYNPGEQTTLTDSKGNTTNYAIFPYGGRYRIMGAYGPTCATCGAEPNGSYDYDQFGNQLDVFDASTNEDKSFTYDSMGNITALDYYVTLNGSPQDVNYTYTYNNFGEVLTVADPLGNVTTNTYDAKGNLLTTTTASGSTTTFIYDSKGQLLTARDPRGNTTSMAYTAAGLVSSITDPQSNVTSYQYDGRANRTSMTDAAGQTTNYAYDVMNRLTKATYPDSSTTQFAYDVRGRRSSITDGDGKVTSYGYDDADRLMSVTDAAGHAIAYAYDTENNLTSITDAAGRTTSFVYDANRRLTQSTFPSSLTEQYSYDVDGNMLTKTDRKGNTVNYTYDQLNRLIQKSYPDSTSVSYTYDLARLNQVSDPTGTYQFTYDNMGRLTSTTASYTFLTARNFTTSYSYDAASNRTGFSDPEGGSTSYAYDTLNRLQTLTPPTVISGGYSFGFGYDALSRRTQMTRPNGVATNYSYDNLSRLMSVLHQAGTTSDGASYTLDNAGNRTAKTDQYAGVTSNYVYDATYQLTQVTQATSQATNTTESYTYDAVGNRLTSLSGNYAVNSSNAMTSNPAATFTYDSNGNVLTKNDSTGTTSYSWDFENRLTSVALPAGSGGTVSFKYDPFGRRIYKSSSAVTSVYAYDGDNLVDQTDGTGTVVARYAQGLSIDEPLAMLRSSATSYYEADGLGSITSVTNSSGAIANAYTYDSFGNLTGSSGSLTNSFRYTSREFDPETNLYYYRARYYDPQAGRFLSEDPSRFNAGVNFYAYVGNSPLDLTDPFGLCPQFPKTDYCKYRGKSLSPADFAAKGKAFINELNTMLKV